MIKKYQHSLFEKMIPYMTDKYGNAVSSHTTPCCC